MTGLLYLHMTQKSVFYTHIRIPHYVTCVRMGGGGIEDTHLRVRCTYNKSKEHGATFVWR